MISNDELGVVGIELSEAELADVQGGVPKWLKTVWNVTKKVAEGVILIGGAIVAGGKAASTLGLTGSNPPPPPPPSSNGPIFI
jgi:hypothetical protein